MGVTDSYSGIVINQNAASTGQFAWRSNGAGWVYQTFTLPTNYQRGTSAGEQIVPDLCGFQVFMSIDAGDGAAASLDYTLDYLDTNSGWNNLTNGTVIGSHADGSQVWYDVIFTNSVAITPSILDSQLRFGIQSRTASNAALGVPVQTSEAGANTYIINSLAYNATLVSGIPSPITVGGQPAFLLLDNGTVTYSVQQGINSLWYVEPTPLTQSSTGQGMAFQSDGSTPLLGSGTTASLGFRILGLVADSGTDFLSNEYRSAVIMASPGNTSTTTGSSPVQGSGSAPYYMSPPQPSKFAVVSLYSDVRPTPASPAYGAVNTIGNPSFEYDVPGQAPHWWTPFISGSPTIVDQTVKNNTLAPGSANYAPWVGAGEQSLHMKYIFPAINQQAGVISPINAINPIAGSASISISVSLAYDIISGTNAALLFTLLFYDSTQTRLPPPYGTQSFDPSTTGISSFSATTTVPANAAYVSYMVTVSDTGVGSFECYVDTIQATLTAQPIPYFDGDMNGVQWTGQRGQSSSVQIIDSDTQDNAVVVDGVLVDPITPNMAMNVYYSQDDSFTSDSMSESDWEQKLWTRVPQSYLLTQCQQYVFPEPVQAKYMKLEFTNLPAQSYTPGNFQKAVNYKKFPTWVANFFISSMEVPSFIASQVTVQYDALSFAYQYFLDDLDQSPAMPSAAPQDIVSQLNSTFNTLPTNLDATTLSQISLVMNTFNQPSSTNVNVNSSLGSYISNVASTNSTQFNTAEGGTVVQPDLSTVSTLQREPVIFEQSLPVMYFFVTCRHAYKELAASLDFNRAYFAGLNSFTFIRSNYTVAADTPLYIESGGDAANVEFTDWVVGTNNIWYTYAS